MGQIAGGYKYIKNFLTPEELKLLRSYTEYFHQFNVTHFDCSGMNDNFDTYYYSDPIMESLLFNKTELMEKETQIKKLLPSYTFWRFYTYGAELKHHIDRDSCEISVTLPLYVSDPWPINMGDKTNSINIEPGDAIAYNGRDIYHGRDPFKGDGQSQVFLHYVDGNGPYKEWANDKRPALGYPGDLRKDG